MNSKKVYTAIERVKDSNGNVTSSTERNILVNKTQESFIMLTTTDGIDWISPIRNYLAFLVCLFSYADKNGIVSLTPLRKAEIQALFKWKSRGQVDNALGILLEYNCIKRIGRGDYIVNPDTIFSGGTITKAEKSNLYNSIV